MQCIEHIPTLYLYVQPFRTRGDLFRLLITLANGLDLDQDQFY